VHQQETLLRSLEVLRRCERQAVVEVELVVIVHVGLDRVQVYIDVIKLPHEKETRRHALSSWNGVALVSRRAYQLETLLSGFHMISRSSCLAESCMNDAFQDIFLRCRRLQVTNQLEGFINGVVSQVINNLK
jgi:hypothetical protein